MVSLAAIVPWALDFVAVKDKPRHEIGAYVRPHGRDKQRFSTRPDIRERNGCCRGRANRREESMMVVFVQQAVAEAIQQLGTGHGSIGAYFLLPSHIHRVTQQDDNKPKHADLLLEGRVHRDSKSPVTGCCRLKLTQSRRIRETKFLAAQRSRALRTSSSGGRLSSLAGLSSEETFEGRGRGTLW